MTLTDGILQFFNKDVPEEEKKEEEPSGEERKAVEDVKEDEEEKQIQAEEDYKVRCRKYLFYLQKVKGAGEDGELSNDESYNVEGRMYTETSLFRIIKALDQIISLSMERQEGLNIIQKFSNPECLKHIIELSVEAST